MTAINRALTRIHGKPVRPYTKGAMISMPRKFQGKARGKGKKK